MSDYTIKNLIKIDGTYFDKQAYDKGYEQGATDMENAKQIIIDSLLKQIEQIRAEAIDEFLKMVEDFITYSYRHIEYSDLMDIAEQLKEKKK